MAERVAQFMDLPDSCLALAFAYLAEGSLACSAATCTQIVSVARADRLWLPLAARRWRFGTAATSSSLLTPGARDVASANALAAALAVPLNRETDAFGFFHRRCNIDFMVATLTLQFDAAKSVRGTPAGGKRHPMVGAVVQIDGLVKAPQYNGCSAVVTSAVSSETDASQERCGVTLLSLPFFRTLSVNLNRLTVLRPALSLADAQKHVLEIGVDSVDILLRLSLLPDSASRGTASYLLGLVKEEWAVKQWEVLLQDPSRADLLEEGGLVLSQWADPSIDVSAVRAQLKSLADSASSQTAAGASLRDRIDIVNRVLFDEYGLTGNVTNYYDPNNSFLHAVLKARKGIPISLSIIWAALARRLAIPCFLCPSMPQHVLVRVSTGTNSVTEDMYLDVFGRKTMDFQGLQAFVNGMGIPFNALVNTDFVAERPATAVYARQLRNLMGIYGSALERNTRWDVAGLQDYIAVLSQSIVVAGAAEQRGLRQQRDMVREQRDRALGIVG
mmetsp:Transcript_29341/g.51394  ORF Transcript_29341/g.51394 Transcript_29341/m.51394 type:complete len:502 (-) Transcript_29341:51-1556(-)